MVDPRRDWNLEEDPLPKEALDKILDLVGRLPREFDCSGIDATHKGKATVRLEFPGVADAVTAAETAEHMLNAVTVVETLARNLAFCRELLADLMADMEVVESRGGRVVPMDPSWWLGFRAIGDDAVEVTEAQATFLQGLG